MNRVPLWLRHAWRNAADSASRRGLPSGPEAGHSGSQRVARDENRAPQQPDAPAEPQDFYTIPDKTSNRSAPDPDRKQWQWSREPPPGWYDDDGNIRNERF